MGAGRKDQGPANLTTRGKKLMSGRIINPNYGQRIEKNDDRV